MSDFADETDGSSGLNANLDFNKGASRPEEDSDQEEDSGDTEKVSSKPAKGKGKAPGKAGAKSTKAAREEVKAKHGGLSVRQVKDVYQQSFGRSCHSPKFRGEARRRLPRTNCIPIS